MSNITFTDLHLHTEYSLKDGKIRITDMKDPKHVPGELIQNAINRNTGAVTATDHGNMYGQALIASMAKIFGLKHIPGCEFYIAPQSRHDKSEKIKSDAYWHICAWAKNKQGYANMCILSKLSFTEGFYYEPRIDKEIIDKYGDGIIWSDACLGGTVSGPISNGDIDGAYQNFMWFLNRFKDDFYIEYQDHNIEAENKANIIKLEWAQKHGVPVIATIDSHFARKDEYESHKMLLSMQYDKKYIDPTFSGFPGNGYWLMNEQELLDRFPIDYLNNTQLIVDKCEGNIIEFGNTVIPKFSVPDWFIDGRN